MSDFADLLSLSKEARATRYADKIVGDGNNSFHFAIRAAYINGFDDCYVNMSKTNKVTEIKNEEMYEIYQAPYEDENKYET